MVIHAKLFLPFCAVRHVKFGMGQPQLHKIIWYILSKKLIEFAALLIYYKQYKYLNLEINDFSFNHRKYCSVRPRRSHTAAGLHPAPKPPSAIVTEKCCMSYLRLRCGSFYSLSNSPVPASGPVPATKYES